MREYRAKHVISDVACAMRTRQISEKATAVKIGPTAVGMH